MVLVKQNVSVSSEPDVNSGRELKPFRFGNVADVLSDSELQLILGGRVKSGYGGDDTKFWCRYTSTAEPWGINTDCYMSLNYAIAFCDFWVTAGHTCSCYSC